MSHEPGEIIVERVRMIGEAGMPKQSFDQLTQEEYWIWLTEPDPDQFPPTMHELRDYLLRQAQAE